MIKADLQRFGEPSSIDACGIKRKIKEQGFCILSRGEQNISCDRWLLHVARQVGQPIGHGERGPLVWPITPVGGPATTYSQHNQEADLHTDGQFLLQPPEVIGMICDHQATCGGGATLLLDAFDVLAEISESGHQDLIDYFSNPVPFRVPEAFAEATSHKVVWAPVFAERTIRYRYDTLLRAAREALDDDQRRVVESRLELLNAMIQQSRQRRATLLRHGEIIFVDNRRMLHGRTGFSDLRRSLWRVYLTIDAPKEAACLVSKSQNEDR